MKKNFLLVAFVIYVLARISIKSERYLRSTSYGKVIQLNQNGIFQNSLAPNSESSSNDNNSKRNNNSKFSEHNNKESIDLLQNKKYENNKKKETIYSQGIYKKFYRNKLVDDKLLESYNQSKDNETKFPKDFKLINSSHYINMDKLGKYINRENKKINLIQIKKDSPKDQVDKLKNAINKKADKIIPNLDNKNLIVLDRINSDKSIF